MLRDVAENRVERLLGLRKCGAGIGDPGCGRRRRPSVETGPLQVVERQQYVEVLVAIQYLVAGLTELSEDASRALDLVARCQGVEVHESTFEWVKGLRKQSPVDEPMDI